MKIKLISLTVNCKQSVEFIDLSHQVSIFHGQIGSGKSTILRLIDYSLGGKLEVTPAINAEFVSCSLVIELGEFKTLFERTLEGNSIQVSWQNQAGESAMVLAPVAAGDKEIWDGGIYGVSDLILHLLGQDVLKVRRSKSDEESPLIRLSFRDIMWYCYLDQDHLDSSFFRLESGFKQGKSRDVLRFIFGYFTRKLNELQKLEEEYRLEKNRKEETAKELRGFLRQFGFDSEEQIGLEIQSIQNQLHSLRLDRTDIESGYRSDTHPADELRNRIRDLHERLGDEEQTLHELTHRISEQSSLREELISTKFKLTKVHSVSKILAGVSYEFCPCCGLPVPENRKENECTVCGQEEKADDSIHGEEYERVKVDLDSRIIDLDRSLLTHRRFLKIQEKKIRALTEHKKRMDLRLEQELENYDTSFLSSVRELDRKIATLEEKLKGLGRISAMPEQITALEARCDTLTSELNRIKREMEFEYGSMKKADDLIAELEREFIVTLLKVNYPGINENDEAHINRRTWETVIRSEGSSDYEWNFYNAGSGGKKTLFNVCFAIALHVVAERNGLPLPNFLILDTPMKNIGEIKNKEIFKNLYNYIYEKTVSELNGTQVIIVDKAFYQPEIEVDLKERFMTPSDDQNPPLIRYYRGS